MTTTMNGPDSTAGAPGSTHALRRSRTDRMITGVAGGLGEYFRVDPVIFRVLFAVLSFFGGVGLIVYIACWLLMPEPDVQVSALDRAILQLRVHRVPPWLVIVGGALILWIGWFSWWAPGPTFPALAVLTVLLIVLVRRLSTPSAPPPSAPPPYAPPPAAYGPASWPAPGPTSGPGFPPPSGFGPAYPAAGYGPAHPEATAGPAGEPGPEPGDESTVETEPAPDEPTAGQEPPLWQQEQFAAQGQFTPTERLAPPLNDPRRNMAAWYAEAREAQRERRARRRPLRVVGAVVLIVGLAFIAILDAAVGISFATYLWFLLAVFGIGFVVSVASRRTLWGYGLLTLPLIPALIVFGGTHASLKDGSGQVALVPSSMAQLHDLRQFAGQTTLDLTSLPTVDTDRTVNIRQGAGEVVLRVPATMNVVVHGNVHAGDVELGNSNAFGDHQGGMNTTVTVPPLASAAHGPTLTISVTLTAGHVQIDRVG